MAEEKDTDITVSVVLPKSMNEYLLWKMKNQDLSKSQVVRQMIRKDMEETNQVEKVANG